MCQLRNSTITPLSKNIEESKESEDMRIESLDDEAGIQKDLEDLTDILVNNEITVQTRNNQKAQITTSNTVVLH